MGHSSWGEQLESNEEAGISRVCRPGLVSWLLPELSPELWEMRTKRGMLLGSLGTVLPESHCDGTFGLPWGHGSNACLSWELVNEDAAQGITIIFQPGAWLRCEHQGVVGGGHGSHP